LDSKAESQIKEKEEDPKSRSLGIKDKQFMHLEAKVIPANAEKPKGKEMNSDIAPAVGGFKNAIDEKSTEMGERGNQKFQNPDSREQTTVGFSSRTEKKKETGSPTKSEFQKNFDDLIKQAKFDIVQNGKSTAEIVMNPKEFGRLTLKVTVKGEQVEGRILVDNEEVKSLIQNELAKLKENLRESGLQLESLQVDLWNDTAFLSSGNQNSESFQNAKDYQDYLNAAKSSFESRTKKSETNEESELLETTESLKTLEIFA
jgi:flagellar hook-length control protein FliK